MPIIFHLSVIAIAIELVNKYSNNPIQRLEAYIIGILLVLYVMHNNINQLKRVNKDRPKENQLNKSDLKLKQVDKNKLTESKTKEDRSNDS